MKFPQEQSNYVYKYNYNWRNNDKKNNLQLMNNMVLK